MCPLSDVYGIDAPFRSTPGRVATSRSKISIAASGGGGVDGLAIAGAYAAGGPGAGPAESGA